MSPTLVWALIDGNDAGWLAPLIIVRFVGAALFFAVFGFAELRQQRPMIDFELFRNRRFLGSGALDVMHYPDGPAPRFGSCFFLLRPDVAQRSTFTFGGSHEDCALDRTGTLDVMEPILAPLLLQLERGVGAFAAADLSVEGCLTLMAQNFSAPFPEPAFRCLGRALDSFIEVQVHGDLRIRHDVELLVVDPAFRDHPVGEVLHAISNEYQIPINWHPGYQMAVSEVPSVFRDYAVRPLAERIAIRGTLDAAIVGAGANSVRLSPKMWEGWASDDDLLAQFRRLWHILVLTGAPRST